MPTVSLPGDPVLVFTAGRTKATILSLHSCLVLSTFVMFRWGLVAVSKSAARIAGVGVLGF